MDCSNVEDTDVVLLPHYELPRESSRSDLLAIILAGRRQFLLELLQLRFK